ncbi:MAG: DUF3224 domain-containing protein [Thermomicrobiales bacterium]|nr:DUF3224 domain-containing protein [Thermomicrobiales bacterium]
MKRTGHYAIQKWEQTPIEGESTFDHAVVSIAFTGDLTGDGLTRYLMTRLPGGAMSYTGYIRFDGILDDRTGSFLLLDTGWYDGAEIARGSFEIVTGSGSGDLAGIRGSGHYMATHKDAVEFAGHTWEPTPEGTASWIMDIEIGDA